MTKRAAWYNQNMKPLTKTDFKVIYEDKERREKRLMRKRRTNPRFETQIQTALAKLRGGKSFYEIRHEMQVKDQKGWDDIQYIISRTVYSPEKCAIEWGVRLASQYQMAADLYNRAKAKNDLKNEAAAILLMSRLTEQDFTLKRELGLIKPLMTNDGSSGYSDEDVKNIDVEAEMRKKLEERILAKMELQRTTEGPKPIALLVGPDLERKTNRMEQATLVDVTPDRQEPTNQNTKGITDGGQHVLDTVVTVVSENKASS